MTGIILRLPTMSLRYRARTTAATNKSSVVFAGGGVVGSTSSVIIVSGGTFAELNGQPGSDALELQDTVTGDLKSSGLHVDQRKTMVGAPLASD